jgi:hypothetical protein
MGRIGSAKIVAVVGHVLAEVVREVVAAIIAIAAGDIGADYDAIPDLERDALEVCVAAVSADGSDGTDIFVALNNGETNVLAFACSSVLRGVSLIGVLVGAADAGDLHLDEHAAERRVGKGIFADLVLSGLY